MKNRNGMRYRFLLGMAALVLGLGIFGWGFAMTGLVSHAETQAKVISPKGVNIRKEASATSDRVGGAENGNVLPVLSQVQGSDGNTWYQVKSGEVTGYIRADLVEVSEGGTSAPAEGGEAGGEGGEQTPPPEVTAVNPVSATVSQESGRIRDSASSDGQILQEVPIDTALTVTGRATDADGRDWYQVSFTSGETQVEGFIRYDYVTLAGELTPLTEGEPEPEAPTEPEPDESKPYDTLMQDGAWLLVDYTLPEPKGYPILELFDSVTGNQEAYQESEKTVKSQKIIIIVLVFALVAAAAGIAFLVFKIRDMMDSAYFNEVEKETLKKKTTAGRGGQRAMPAAEGEKTAQRPQGASQRPRPTGAQSQRPAGAPQRTGNSSPQGQRPAGAPTGQRIAPQGQRPMSAAPGQRAGGSPQGVRPAGAQGQRPAGGPAGRPTGAVAGQRPAGATAGQRQTATPQGQRTQGALQNARPVRSAPAPAQKAQPKNFLADDDDFDNEFRNYDDE